MKTLRFVCFCFIAGLLASCDANLGKVEDASKKFIEALNSKDKVTLYEMFPEMKDFKNLTITENITPQDIDVSFNKEDSVYEAVVNAEKEQKIIFKANDAGEVSIKDCYNIMSLDSASLELALKTGVPLKHISDVEKSNLMDPEKEFIAFLGELYPSAIGGNLVYESGSYSWGRNYGSYFMNYEFGVRNTGTSQVESDDYTIEVDIVNRTTDETLITKTVWAPTLAPGERQNVTLFAPEYYSYAVDHNLHFTVRFVFKNMSSTQLLLKYGEFTGKEFDEFMKKKDEPKKEKPDQAGEEEKANE